MSTYRPSREEFGRLAASYRVVPVCREVLADLETPLSVYAKLRGDRSSFLLESAEHGERWGRYSFVGVDPFLVLRGKDGAVSWEGEPPPGMAQAKGPLEALDVAIRELAAPPLEHVPPLHGGAVGYVGWEAVREIERIPATTEDDLGLPDVLMLFPRHVVAFDHLRQKLTVATNVVIGADPEAQYHDAVVANDALVARLATATPSRPVSPPAPGPVGDVPTNLAPGEYERMVQKALEHIAAGDIFQVVPSQRFALHTTATPFDVYRMLRVINPSPYLFLFDFGDLHVVGSSPEALVRVKGRHVETWPIAGTRPRGRGEEEDRMLERELLASEKERAEHVMLVDLGRNDVGRVCEVGSVEVAELMVVERYSHVMHLVSRVVGKLREGTTPVDVLRAVFPAGTVSGAPKVRAMQIIDDLEPTRRGVYAGAVGYVDLSGNLDTCIALRTLVMRSGVAYAQAGAGIVADSLPAEEETETRNKAMALLEAVKAAEELGQGQWAGEAGAGARGTRTR
ncbi:MAG: anthranilate synthase component I [Actinomycetota bacterium]|nr:anthranilate synthase component I [Actinomycetota bacterium]